MSQSPHFAEKWERFDTLYSTVASVIVTADCVFHVHLMILLGLHGDYFWMCFCLIVQILRIILSILLLNSDHPNMQLQYALMTVLQLNFVYDAYHNVQNRKYCSSFYWGKFVQCTLQSIPICFLQLYILLEETGYIRIATVSIPLSLLSIALSAADSGFAPMYRFGWRRWMTFLLRMSEAASSVLAVALFAHHYRVFVFLLLALKYSSSVMLVMRNNWGSDSIGKVFILAILGSLLDIAIVWFASAKPGKSARLGQEEISFIVEDGNVRRFSVATLVSDIFTVFCVVAVCLTKDVFDSSKETFYVIITIAAWFLQHLMTLILVLFHPRPSSSHMVGLE